MARKQARIGVRRGAGEPPFLWEIWILDRAFEEAMLFLSGDQYRHLALQFQQLARQQDPTHSESISLDAVEDFFELRDWGGVLHPRNVRVFYGVDKIARRIIVLGAIDKKNDGPTLVGDKTRMRVRWRRYRQGELA